MDPNANLTESLLIAKRVQRGRGLVDEDALSLADRVVALDKWIREGGALPQVWQKCSVDSKFDGSEEK